MARLSPPCGCIGQTRILCFVLLHTIRQYTPMTYSASFSFRLLLAYRGNKSPLQYQVHISYIGSPPPAFHLVDGVKGWQQPWTFECSRQASCLTAGRNRIIIGKLTLAHMSYAWQLCSMKVHAKTMVMRCHQCTPTIVSVTLCYLVVPPRNHPANSVADNRFVSATRCDDSIIPLSNLVATRHLVYCLVHNNMEDLTRGGDRTLSPP